MLNLLAPLVPESLLQPHSLHVDGLDLDQQAHVVSKPKFRPQLMPHWLRWMVVSKSLPHTCRLISGLR